jgi:hypothetical protein
MDASALPILKPATPCAIVLVQSQPPKKAPPPLTPIFKEAARPKTLRDAFKKAAGEPYKLPEPPKSGRPPGSGLGGGPKPPKM